jgi:hypothetical protein
LVSPLFSSSTNRRRGTSESKQREEKEGENGGEKAARKRGGLFPSLEKGPKREIEKLKNSLTMMAFITCGFCIAAASSGSFMIFAIMSAGAYGMAMSSNYNTRPRAAEVMIDGAEAHLVRRRETVEELYALESPLP